MTERTDPEKHRAQVRAANRARHRATKTLIALHPDEFARLYASEAAKEGVEPKPREVSEVVKLREQVTELSQRLMKVTKVKPKRATGTRR